MNDQKARDINPVAHIAQEKLLEFRRKLLVWYATNGRRFIWRKKSATKYKLVISELLLQRTRAETVATFFDKFMKQYPSWRELAKATESEIGDVIRPIGLWNRRAIVLKRLAVAMVGINGRFPATRGEIEALPGIGQYIANAVLLLCHGNPQPLLDGNMARVLERVFGPRKLADIRYDPYLQSLSLEVVRCEKPREINWAILDLAATICLARIPRCEDCPLNCICSYALGRIPSG
jgi:A/G-specific adenine glycosylase